MLERELLDLPCCSKCNGELTDAPKDETLTRKYCHAVYFVDNGIPAMLPEDTAKSSPL